MGKVLDLENALPAIKTWAKGLFSTKADTIKNITRSGTTFTATRADNTTFTFTQQDTTYTPAKLGFGYGTCSTAAATAEKAVTLSNYTLTAGGYVAVKFTYKVTAGNKLNVNSKGAKDIYYQGSPITDDIISGGDTALFVYDGTRYHLLAIDDYGTTCHYCGSVNSQSQLPSSANVGDIYYVKESGGMVLWNGASWSTVTPGTFGWGISGLVPGADETDEKDYLLAPSGNWADVRIYTNDTDQSVAGEYSYDSTLNIMYFKINSAAANTIGAVFLSDATNGTEVAASGKTAATPKAVADALAAAKSYTNSKVTGMLNYKGSKTNYSDLPSSGNTKGDVWNVVNAHGDYPAGTNYAWDGSTWDPLGGAFSIDFATAAEVTASLNS